MSKHFIKILFSHNIANQKKKKNQYIDYICTAKKNVAGFCKTN